MSDESAALSELAGIEFKDARLYALLDRLIRDFYALDRQVNPVIATVTGTSGTLPITDGVSGLTATLFSNNLRLTWNELTGATSYEIRYLAGVKVSADWNTANILLRTSTFSADLNPVTIPLTTGSHTFFIKGSGGDTESTNAAIAVLAIPVMGAPVISPLVIDNNVLLNWSVPTSSIEIAYYNVYKNGTFIGTMNGTFEAIFETTGGSYLYAVEAVDIVGNISTRGSIAAVVNQPPDYELQDNQTSLLLGSRSHVAYDVFLGTPRLIANVDICTDYIINLMPKFTPMLSNPLRPKRTLQTIQEDRKI